MTLRVFTIVAVCSLAAACGLESSGSVPAPSFQGQSVEIKNSQYFPDVVAEFGNNACGLIALATGFTSDPAEQLDLMIALRDHADEAYSAAAGIQPSKLAAAARRVFGDDNVVESADGTLDEVMRLRAAGYHVVVDILVQETTEVPSTEGATFAHFARVLDAHDDHVVLENTLQGDPSWTLNTDEFASVWANPEKRAYYTWRHAEEVNYWYVAVHSDAMPKLTSSE